MVAAMLDDLMAVSRRKGVTLVELSVPGSSSGSRKFMITVHLQNASIPHGGRRRFWGDSLGEALESLYGAIAKGDL
jgi:hypothetical protein